ncbi:serine/threonine protein kinase [Kinneretia aquatilis]|uniref:serine/threonine protein kinase n=1 Tax=Kinneretia aquatilis TaxID=2070761 RepID=UPI001CBF42A7|nr:serine/threonine-protein kinase [Paucibacter aquatile]WIV98318.1 protein kinase [Paucibacter aquatile]
MSDTPIDRTGLRSPGLPVDDVNALPPGTRFGALEIVRTLGVGGFGIVYLARDHALERELAIKEYMPGQLAQRGEGSVVSVRSGSLSETFEIGRRSFVNEARLLARFDHRSLLKVYQFWEANGTAYMAMPYLQGQTLRQRREDINAGRAPALDEAALRALLLPLLEALILLHASAVYHRDIAPDNILMPADGSDPILLDFGAARRAIGDRTQTFTAILKPSYAPIEQYAESTALRQGPWTDVYALGAVVHYLLTGQPPPPATARAVVDDYEPLAGRALPGCSRAFLAAVDWALAVRPLERPQSMEAFRDALTGQREAPGLHEADLPLPLSEDGSEGADDDVTVIQPRPRTVPLAKPAPNALAEAATLVQPPPSAAPASRPAKAAVAPGLAPVAAPASAPVAGKARSVPPLAMAAVALLLVLAAGGWWAKSRDGGAAPSLELAAASAPSSGSSAASASAVPVPASAPATDPALAQAGRAPASAPAQTMVPAPAAVVLGPAPAPLLNPNGGNRASPSAAAASSSRLAAQAPSQSQVQTVRTDARRPGKEGVASAPAPGAAANKLPPMPQQDASLAVATPAQIAAAATQAASAAQAAGHEEAPAAPLDPRQACAKENILLRVWCVDRRCEKPAYAGHAECVRLREIREQRRER